MSAVGQPGQRVAVIGAGWAGLAAAVEATRLGHQVTLMDMADQPGGRARSLQGSGGSALDNGQHILIGAYHQTLALMRQVGVEPEQTLRRSALDLRYPDGTGLALPAGPALLAFVRGVLGWRALPLRSRLGLLALAASWQWRGFDCPAEWSVSQLCRDAPEQVLRELIEPLCVAALNTPADQASAQVFLNVLRDALFGPAGSADLLLPKAPLQALLPEPALGWLLLHGARWRPRYRALSLQALASGGALVNGEPFDGVIVATHAKEASRLAMPLNPAWAEQAEAMGYQPITTVWLQAPSARWSRPMLALRCNDQAPAQFGFSLGDLGGAPGLFAFVISGAASWVEQGQATVVEAVLAQLTESFHGSPAQWNPAEVSLVAVRTEKRATFACTPSLQRPPGQFGPSLLAAGDYVVGRYPATLEGAVRSGLAAAQQI